MYHTSEGCYLEVLKCLPGQEIIPVSLQCTCECEGVWDVEWISGCGERVSVTMHIRTTVSRG